MKKLLIIAPLAAFVVFGLYKLGYRNVDSTKANAASVWEKSGFHIVGYEGYQWEPLYGGAVWYIVSRNGDSRIIYHGFIGKWGSEYHICNIQAIDALSP